jgi:tetratricopeptide (TPR) repeat protein
MTPRFGCAILGLLLLSATAPAAGQSVVVTEKLEDLQARAVRDSTDPVAHYNLAMGFWSKKRYADAETSLRTATRLDSQFADAYLALSVVRNWDDDYWKQLRKQEGDSGFARVGRESDANFRKAFLIDPLVNIKILGSSFRIYSRSRFARAFENLVEGRYDKAYETLDKELKFWGGRAGADSAPHFLVWLHGLSAAHSNQYDVAIHDMETLVTRMQTAAKADSSDEVPLEANEYRYLMAALHQKAGRIDQAVPIYQEVARNDLGNYMAHVQLARIYEAQRDWPKAVQERSSAVDANPDDPSLLTDLGITLGKAGMMPQAETRFRSAYEANPRDVRPLFWLGLALMEQGKREEAKDAFAKFVAVAPSRLDRQLTMAKERLATLQ